MGEKEKRRFIPPGWAKTWIYIVFRLPNLSFKNRIKSSQNDEHKKSVLGPKENKKSAHEEALFRKKEASE
jgi:hypothetical protein